MSHELLSLYVVMFIFYHRIKKKSGTLRLDWHKLNKVRLS